MNRHAEPGIGGGAGGPRGFRWAPRPGGVFGRAQSVYAQWRGAPTWAQRTAAVAALLVVVGIAAVLLVLGLAVGAVIAVVVGAVLAVRLGWARLRGVLRGETRVSQHAEPAPLEPLRENVRVVIRQGDGPGAG